MVGTTPLFRRDKLESILAVLEREPQLAPETWSLAERGGIPYARAEVFARIAKYEGKPMRQAILYLRRKHAPAVDVRLHLGTRPAIYVSAKLPAKHHAELFALADRLAEVFQPDWGAAHVWIGEHDPFRNDDERGAVLMVEAAMLAPVNYYDAGPLGLAMRTYIGPHYVEQFGAKLIAKLPVEVEKTRWGGYRIELAPTPWTRELPALLAAWRKAMAPLRDAKLLAVPKISKGRIGDLAKSPKLAIGGSVNGTN